LKVGVIGVGYWGKKHVDEYSNLGHEIFVSDLSPENMNFCKSNFGANPVADYTEILNNNKIKCISICTPNSTHYKFAIEALKAGKNILLEKPIATNIKDAKEIISLANQKNLILLIGHIFRFSNVINKIKELLDSNKLGIIYTIKMIWTNYEPVFHNRDILFDLGVHPLDIIDNLFQCTPSNLYCTGEGFRQQNPEYAIINYHFNNKVDHRNIFVNIELSWLNPIRNRKIILVGSEKTAIVDCVPQTISIINNKSGIIESLAITPNNTIQDELRYFLEKSSLNQKISLPAPSGEVAIKILEIIEIAKKSMNYVKQFTD
jgi:UDP-N-acetylglucosamine 3-dehydrogenase